MSDCIRKLAALVCAIALVGAFLLPGRKLPAQEPLAPATEGAAATAEDDGPTLTESQAAIRMRYSRFEDTLLKMARYLQKTEPARAELVLRALGRSQEEQVADRMDALIEMLSKEDGKSARYADAIDEQEALLANLRELLTILRSEDILDENRKEQERLKELARQVSALIDAEKVHQADTRRGDPTDRIAEAQDRTARRTDDVIKKVDEHDRAASQGGERGADDSGETPAGETPPGERSAEDTDSGQEGKGQEGAGKESDENGAQENQQPGDGSESETDDTERQNGSEQDGAEGQQGQESQEGQQGQEGQEGQQGQQGQDGQQSPDGPQQDSKEPPRGTPGREELEAARERMERAIEELKAKNRENASQSQEEAIRKLIEAKEKIEELLRQLREEERELMLRALEARFQKMLQLQQEVLATTEELSGVSHDQWQDREFARCRDAAATEREIGIEAEKALTVLRADGSSVAFPEAVGQVRDDVAEVARRLGREDAGELTVAIERDIVDALEEMILALQKEMEKIREQKSQQQQQQQGDQGDPALVDALAELKMLKTLQLRINRRTKVIGRLFTGEQATEPDVVSQLQELAERQGRVQRATYDLAIGKTAD